MTMGKGGPNYWYTEGDARRACEGALAGVTFLVTVGQYQFSFIPGKRVVAGQWISEDCEFIVGMIAHITMTIDKLTCSPAKESAEEYKAAREAAGGKEPAPPYHALLAVSNLHYTVRSKADSDWIEKNIGKVVAAQQRKEVTADVERYNAIQRSSLHRGLKNNWNSGNKANNDSAVEALGGKAALARFPDNLDKVAGLISTVGAQALKGKTLAYSGSKKADFTMRIHTAAIEVS